MIFTSYDVSLVRHIVQHILVPCVFIIGLLGNSVSIYVLTRKRMRCTTNIYLTALAVTDLIYLTMALLLSLQHYTVIHCCCKFYWLTFGVVHWLCDACAYISIYIAVCFTVERFIAVRYPLKRQSFCTETLAKKVITGVTIFCLVTTMCTAFEHDFITTFQLITPSGKSCNQSAFIVQFNQDMPLSYMELSITLQPNNASMKGNDVEGVYSSVETDIENNGGEHSKNLRKDQHSQQLSQQNANILIESSTLPSIITSKFRPTTNAFRNNCCIEYSKQDEDNLAYKNDVANKMVPSTQKSHKVLNFTNISTNFNDTVSHNYFGENGKKPLASVDYPSASPQIGPTKLTDTALHNCLNITYYEHTASALGKNDMYLKIWYFFTLFIFVLVPLCMLVTFNTFLILLVHKSRAMRGEMTNSHSIRRTRQLTKRSMSMSMSQENRITVTLIAVVLLFIICQLPWAIYLIVSEHVEIDINTRIIIGNIFNFLSALNAAANFFVYCVLSDKYRKMVRELITGRRYRQYRPTLSSTRTSGYMNDRVSTYRSTNTSMVIK